MISILVFNLPASPLQTKLHPTEYLLCFLRNLLTFFTMIATNMVKGNKIIIPLLLNVHDQFSIKTFSWDITLSAGIY